MPRKAQGVVPVDSGLIARLKRDSRFAKAFFEAYMEASVPIQAALLRTMLGVTQAELAQKLGVKQTHFSRLEKDGTNHKIAIYGKIAKQLGGRIAILPAGVKLVWNKPIETFRPRKLPAKR